jgi:hypothetical protein
MVRPSLLLLPLILTVITGCVRVEVAPIKATVDVNLKVDRSLDEFYSFQQPATRPATQEAAVVLPSTATQPAVPVQ